VHPSAEDETGGSPVSLRRTRRGWHVLSPAGADDVDGLVEGLTLADLIAEEFGSLAEPDRTTRRSARGSTEPAGDVDPVDARIAALERTVAQLEHALAARVATERAIGVLAERFGTDPRAAFETLRKDARSQGRPVAELAREVLDAMVPRGDAAIVPIAVVPPIPRLDFYIRVRDREQAIVTLAGAGFADYHAELPYDRRWIYRSTRDGVIVDLIWSMANRRAEVDDSWFVHAPETWLRGQRVHVLPAEELLWCKLYVLQRDRCDWPDLINLLYATGTHLDWERLLARTEDDEALVHALLHVYSWVCPHYIKKLPNALVEQFNLRIPAAASDTAALERRRIELLDSRPWFAALQPEDKPLKL
jgi:hypothetical protein